MNGDDHAAGGLLILALAPVQLDPLLIGLSLVGFVLLGVARVTWVAARRRNSTPLTYLALVLVVLGFALLVAPPLSALAALG